MRAEELRRKRFIEGTKEKIFMNEEKKEEKKEAIERIIKKGHYYKPSIPRDRTLDEIIEKIKKSGIKISLFIKRAIINEYERIKDIILNIEKIRKEYEE